MRRRRRYQKRQNNMKEFITIFKEALSRGNSEVFYEIEEVHENDTFGYRILEVAPKGEDVAVSQIAEVTAQSSDIETEQDKDNVLFHFFTSLIRTMMLGVETAITRNGGDNRGTLTPEYADDEINRSIIVDVDSTRTPVVKLLTAGEALYDRERLQDVHRDDEAMLLTLAYGLMTHIITAEKSGNTYKKGEAMTRAIDLLNALYIDVGLTVEDLEGKNTSDSFSEGREKRD